MNVSDREQLLSRLQRLEETVEEQASILAEIRVRHPSRDGAASDEDARQAAILASQNARGLLRVGVAAFVVGAGFLQFLVSRGITLGSLPIMLLGVSILLTVISMACGFLAISGLYRRGEGSIVSENPWSTRNVRFQIDGKAWAGVGALLFLLGSVLSSTGKLQ